MDFVLLPLLTHKNILIRDLLVMSNMLKYSRQ